ncbi:MAG TPA: carboxypeptidase-like regulatory domain-containing protein, partial [Acidobacteriaceae bacterium]|nr:carboxypeptidase-like regulatory domain-containing protein [Acidobacteriaceae bacterium]
MKSFTKSISALIGIFVVLGSIAAWASITGSISGVVTDPNGAVVPGVTVVATDVATNIQHTTVTDSKG